MQILLDCRVQINPTCEEGRGEGEGVRRLE